MTHVQRRGAMTVLALSLTLVVAPLPAVAEPPAPVDESRLVPSLSDGFAPWTCRTKSDGPVCRGEYHWSRGWAPFDLSCGETQLWARGESARHQTRYYNTDYLDTFREFRTNDVDYLSTSPTGPVTATISTNVRFEETFAVPGDDQTRTITTQGLLWDIRSTQGPPVWRAVGTLVEAPDAVAAFSGQVISGAHSTRFENAPLPEVLSDDTFATAVCSAVTGAR